MDFATQLIHGDDHLRETADIAPTISVSTTFNYAHGNKPLETMADLYEQLKIASIDKESNGVGAQEAQELVQHPPRYVYSRVDRPTVTRIESVLSSVLEGSYQSILVRLMVPGHVLAYASGLSAIHGLLVHLNPRKVAIGGGYHGTHGILKILKRIGNVEAIDLDKVYELGENDVCWLETPVNPYGTAFGMKNEA
jgi:cystathionine beta-lyase/cystathionine gamma-synthase